MASYLSQEAAKEGIEISDEALGMVTRASGGSLRDALSIMDQLVSFTGGRITREGAASLLRVVQDEILEGLTRAILAGRPGEALDCLSGALVMGYSVEELLESLVEYLRNLMLASAGGEAGLSDIPETDLAAFRRLAGTTSDIAVLDILRLVSAAATEARFASQPRIVLESAILAASRLQWAVGLEELPPVTPVGIRPARPADAGPPAPCSASGAGRPVEGSPDAGKAGKAPSLREGRGDDKAGRDEERSTEDDTVEPAAASGEAGGDKGSDNAAGGEREITRSLLDLFDAVTYEGPNDRRPR
jgi:DNA polymerase-3 subunit gamma/tau